MRQPARRDVRIDAPLLAVLRVSPAPVTRIECHHHRHRAGVSRNACRHWYQVFNIRRLAAHPQRHDQLVVMVRQLAVVALQVTSAGLHQMAVGVGVDAVFREAVIALGLVGWCGIGLAGQASSGNGFCCKWFQVRWVQPRVFCCSNRLVASCLGIGGCHLSFFVRVSLLSSWCIRQLRSRCFGTGFFCVLLPLTRCGSSGLG
jgi:hypothetical protein